MGNVAAALEAVIRQMPHLKYSADEPMKNHTSFKIGGSAAAMFFPAGRQELTDLCRILKESGVRPLVIGNGTNLLVEDGRHELLVIKTAGGLSGLRLRGDREIEAESGVSLSRLAVFAMEHGLSGLEFAHGIPGSLGGAVLMNAGAYGGEMRQVVHATQALDRDAAPYETAGEAHEFSYRHSRFSGTGDIIVSSVLTLLPGAPGEIRARMDDLAQRRRESQPLNYPSAGSAFKRPPGAYAAALIDGAGLKGYTVGGAMVSDKHAGFIINKGDARFSDVLAVIDHVRETVFLQTGVALEPEIRIIRRGAGGEG